MKETVNLSSFKWLASFKVVQNKKCVSLLKACTELNDLPWDTHSRRASIWHSCFGVTLSQYWVIYFTVKSILVFKQANFNLIPLSICCKWINAQDWGSTALFPTVVLKISKVNSEIAVIVTIRLLLQGELGLSAFTPVVAVPSFPDDQWTEAHLAWPSAAPSRCTVSTHTKLQGQTAFYNYLKCAPQQHTTWKQQPSQQWMPQNFSKVKTKSSGLKDLFFII